MTAIAVIFVILAAIPTSFTAATQSEDPTRATIVGQVQVVPVPSQLNQAIQDENAKLNERLRDLESRIASMESKQTDHQKRNDPKRPD